MTKAELWAIEKGYNGLKKTPYIFNLLDEYLKDQIQGYIVDGECLDCGEPFSYKLNISLKGEITQKRLR